MRSLAALAGGGAGGPGAAAARLGRLARFENHAFTALNTAFLQDGAVIEVDGGVVFEPPIHLIFVSSSAGAPALSQPRVLLVAGDDSEVRVVESHAGAGDAPWLSNAVTEVSVGDDAVVDHYTVVRQADTAFHVGNLAVRSAGPATSRPTPSPRVGPSCGTRPKSSSAAKGASAR